MINHPAMPKIGTSIPITDCDREILIHAERTFRSVVEWLGEICIEHGKYYHGENDRLYEVRRRCPKCWQSLLEAVKGKQWTGT